MNPAEADVRSCSKGVKRRSHAFKKVLWGGKVVKPALGDITSWVLDSLNKKLYKDERVDLSMLTMGDGLTLAVRR